MIHHNIDIEFIYEFLSDQKSKLIITHENADPDAIGSALVLQSHFPAITVAAYRSVNKVGRRLCSVLDQEVVTDPDPSRFEKLLILDSSSPAQVGNLHLGHDQVLIIDHHAPAGNWPESCFFYIDEGKSSLAELIFEFFWKTVLVKHRQELPGGAGRAVERKISEPGPMLSLELGNLLQRRDALALLCGMVTDTGHFRHANSFTLLAASLLLDSHAIPLGEIYGLVNEDDSSDISRKVAQLKAAQRLQFVITSNRYVLGYSELGSFEGSACNKLLIAGCDVILILSQGRKTFRISGRARYEMTQGGIHLGNSFLSLAGIHGWTAGGHPGAAGLSGEGDGTEALRICVEELQRRMESLAP